MEKLSHKEFTTRLHKVSSTLIPIDEYTGSFNKIIVEDANGIRYLSTPHSLLKGQTPNIKSAIDKNKCFEFNSRLVHSDFYDYSLVEYTKNYNKVTIICPIHGEFSVAPSDHLKGNKCMKCSKDAQTIFKDDFIQRAILKHSTKYNYDLVDYVDYYTKVLIKCNKCNTEFFQVPGNHLHKTHNCPKCRSKLAPGYLRSSWIESCELASNSDPIVYVIRCYNDSEEFIKIGITRRSIADRFPSYLMPYSYEVIKEIKGSPDFVWSKERNLHKLCKPLKYEPQVPFTGDTECFSLDVLKILDTQESLTDS